MSQRHRRHHIGPDLLEAARATWLPWVVARVVVGLAFEASKYRNAHNGPINVRGAAQTANGLMAFDAGWYRTIAEFGYGPTSSQSLRFFPLFPLVIRVVHLIAPLSWATCTALVANAAAFGTAMALYVLVTRDLHDSTLAKRSVWLLCLAPASFVLVFGYAESLFLFFVIGAFLCLRRQRFWWAALLALLAGATRPIGVLLVLPVLVEVVVLWRGSAAKRVVPWLAALIAPLLGFFGFCAWSAAAYGSFWAPLTIQQESSHHGGLTDPLAVIAHASSQTFRGYHVGTGLHVLWIVLSIILIVVAFRRLPLSYAVYSAGVVIVALSGSNLDSFERYLLSAFPLTIAASMWLRSRRVATVVLIATTVAMGGYAFLALQGAYIP